MLKHRYGITSEDYAHLLKSQNGLCAIYDTPETALCNDGSVRALAVDHDHVTEIIRGLLCRDCNLLLGKARDSIALLRTAIAYLEASTA